MPSMNRVLVTFATPQTSRSARQVQTSPARPHETRIRLLHEQQLPLERIEPISLEGLHLISSPCYHRQTPESSDARHPGYLRCREILQRQRNHFPWAELVQGLVFFEWCCSDQDASLRTRLLTGASADVVICSTSPELRHLPPLPQIIRYLSQWTAKHLTFQAVLRRGKYIHRWSRADIVLTMMYLGANMTCILVYFPGMTQAGFRAGRLSIINTILLFAGPHLSFVADMLGVSIRTCRRLHVLAGLVAILLVVFYAIAILSFCVQLIPLTLRHLSYEIALRIHQLLSFVFAYAVWRHIPSVGLFPRLYLTGLDSDEEPGDDGPPCQDPPTAPEVGEPPHHDQQARRQAKELSVGQVAEKVGIKFKLYEDGEWQLTHTLMVDASEPSELRRVVIKYMRKGYGIFDSQNRALTAQTCFERVTSDGTNVIHLAPEWEVGREGQDRKQTINVAEANECTNASMAAQNVWHGHRVKRRAGWNRRCWHRWHTDPHMGAL
ncbi:hypothetical protein BDV39DRAFT_202786 [Aspergillus sergii]|uniref:Uncharacterized protein n=1 Tax=Aspergillus sergii TaxID=1034303 RepID=A0A5N6X9C9_9EURO|nr:hypothetical protein BDV39DRAFT_202786 [Aspergillus sergii]